MTDSTKCPKCGMVSYNPNDIAEGYCGACHEWYENMLPVSKTSPGKPRKNPCGSCPYRQNVPSGVWHEEEYDKLPRYDGEISEQIENGGISAFGCHQADGSICSGWLGHRDPLDMIAVRLGLSSGHLDPSCADYATSVPLFASGAEAAEHGKQEIDNPSPEATKLSHKIVRKRSL